MKKVAILSIVLLSFCATRVSAQAFQAGDNIVSAGIGIGSALDGYGYSSAIPGFSAQYERGIWEAGPGVISLGGYLGIKGYKYSSPDFTEKWNYTIVGARAAYHFTGLDVENLDLYGGLMLSFNNLNFSYTEYNGYNYNGGSYGSYLGLSAFVGARYYFAGNLAGYGELGYGVAILNLGLSYKF